MLKWPVVSIIIPTFNNYEYISRCVKSILLFTPNFYEIIIINNGHEDSLKFLRENEKLKIIHAKENLGWQRALNLGMKEARGDYFLFLNDDVQILDGQPNWLAKLLQPFRLPNVGAVGPISNVVMGSQNFAFMGQVPELYETTLLIGFCMLVSREAMERVGPLDAELPGGDDLDLCIRLRRAGFRLMVNRSVFIYHFGFKTGERVHGDRWNSRRMTEETDIALIRKHGLRDWHEIKTVMNLSEPQKTIEDIEGIIIRELLPEHGRILEVACGSLKTRDDVVGIDIIPKGEKVAPYNSRFGIDNSASVADIQADVFKEEIAEADSIDAIIARHILEHGIDPVFILKHWAKVLKPGGKIIFALPDEELAQSTVLNPEHLHAYTKGSFESLMACALPDFRKELVKDSGNGVSFIASYIKEG